DGRLYLYYGDYVEGEREGSGVWILNGKEHYFYYSIGSWKEDLPNGKQERRSNSSRYIYHPESNLTHFVSENGNVINGLWDGEVVISEKGFDAFIVSNYSHGKVIPYGKRMDRPEDEYYVAVLREKDGWESVPCIAIDSGSIDNLLYGILGFGTMLF
ncbi:MAG: hypothetical protein IJU50_02795, partial [Lachnospiraceae bacterium]|nr:hypothetical protein [Lachnospiraceae bacterium]